MDLVKLKRHNKKRPAVQTGAAGKDPTYQKVLLLVPF